MDSVVKLLIVQIDTTGLFPIENISQTRACSGNVRHSYRLACPCKRSRIQNPTRLTKMTRWEPIDGDAEFSSFFFCLVPSHALNIRFESLYKAQISIRSESTFTHVQSVLVCVGVSPWDHFPSCARLCVCLATWHTQSEPIIWKLPNE